MNTKRRSVAACGQPGPRPPHSPAGNGPIDWPHWLRLIERKRRAVVSPDSPDPKPLPLEYMAAITLASFRLDGIQMDVAELAAGLTAGWAAKGFRSRTSQRVRNHVAILRRIESAIRRGDSLKGISVIRWYTSISCGLSLAALDEPTMTRVDNIVRRINSPHLRLQPAILEIAELHTQLMSDPLVPSFNGILARLLLQYHLSRCGLPLVLFNPETDGKILKDGSRVLKRILEMVDAGYELMSAG